MKVVASCAPASAEGKSHGKPCWSAIPLKASKIIRPQASASAGVAGRIIGVIAASLSGSSSRASVSAMGLQRQPGSRRNAAQANEIPSQIVMKARELTMAAHSDPVSLPEGDTDELPRIMITPSLCAPMLLPQRTSEPLNSTCPTYIGGNGVDVLGDTSAAELALIVGGTREGGCLPSAG